MVSNSTRNGVFLAISLSLGLSGCSNAIAQNVAPENHLTLPVKTEVRGEFTVIRHGQRFVITTQTKGPDLVYQLQLSRDQHDQFVQFFSDFDQKPGPDARAYCYCDGILTPDRVVHLKWANLRWFDPR